MQISLITKAWVGFFGKHALVLSEDSYFTKFMENELHNKHRAWRVLSSSVL